MKKSRASKIADWLNSFRRTEKDIKREVETDFTKQKILSLTSQITLQEHRITYGVESDANKMKRTRLVIMLKKQRSQKIMYLNKIKKT